MKRFALLSMTAALAACGGGEPAEQAPAQTETAPAAAPAATLGAMNMPDWFHVDEANQSVHMTITAGSTSAKNYWNFNGAADGNMTITVPVGYTVMIDFVNNDPNMAHSLGISTKVGGYGATPDVTPAFAGAMTQNPTSMVDATMPGEQESITFVADAAGNYAMVCYIPGHAVTGMWVLFNVSADGSVGVQSAM